MPKEKEKITICIPTCNRNQQLECLLISLGKQKKLPPRYAFEILIVNNDAANDLSPVINRLKENLFPIHNIVVAERGYSNVRNGAVDWVLKRKSAALIFIDDDELVLPNWLERMVTAWQKCKSDIVTGPVEQVLPSSASWFVRKLRLLERNYYAQTGAQLKTANSNNTLVSRKVLTEMGPSFHSDLNHSGGEDTLFFHQCHLRGFSIYWDNALLIQEPTLVERATLSYVLKRWFKNGKTRIRLNIILYPGQWKQISKTLVLNTLIGIFKRLAWSMAKADARKLGETMCLISKLGGLWVQMVEARELER